MSITLVRPELLLPRASSSSLLPVRCTRLHSVPSPRSGGALLLPPATSRRKQQCRSSRVWATAVEAPEPKEDMAWVTFPHLPAAGQRLMSDIAGTMQQELGPLLEQSRTPEDVRYFNNAAGNGEGSVTLRAGKHGSKVDFVLGSWLRVELPFGTLNIATIIAMLGPDTDAPHLLLEFIQNGPDSLVLVLDLLPRKDLVLDPDYLKRVYEDSELESTRVELQKAPGVQPYVSSSLYVRSIISPTALLLKVQGTLASGEPLEGGLDKLITDLLHPSAKKVFLTWLDTFQNKGNTPQGREKDHLVERDDKIKSKGVEVDLSSNLPRLFGQDAADRVVAAFRKGE